MSKAPKIREYEMKQKITIEFEMKMQNIICMNKLIVQYCHNSDI